MKLSGSMCGSEREEAGTMARDRVAGRSTASRTPRKAGLVLASLVAGLGLVAATVIAAPAGAVTPPANGQLTGDVVVSDAPAGFSGEVGVVVCPGSTPSKQLCPSPSFAESGSGGSYTVSLAAGSWLVREYYTVGFSGGAFIGANKLITIGPGQVVRHNIHIRYQVPSSLSGTVELSGIPSGTAVESLSVTACPASSPESDGIPTPLCATDYLPSGSDQYALPTLSKGDWVLSVGYYTQFGLGTATIPGMVKLNKGQVQTANLVATYQAPPNGMIEGTVTVLGAPAGFTGLLGAGACPVSTGPTTVCANPSYTLGNSGDPYELLLSQGQWNLAGFYELAPFGGQFISAVHQVDVIAGTVVHLNLTVPYTAPATINADITVTGIPSGTTLEDSLLLACPADAPYTGGEEPIVCVEGFGPASEPATINTLPPGKWLLYPGYATTTSELIGTQAKAVKLVAGGEKTKHLSVAFAG
jgi:hypothetical protein